MIMKLRRFLGLFIFLGFIIGLDSVFFGIKLPNVYAVSNNLSNVVYEDSFDYEMFEGETLYNNDIWTEEKGKSRPTVENNVLKVSRGYSAQFNYKNISGFSFDKNKTYTLSFNLKVTSFGTDEGDLAREVYIAPGGWYNQIELKNNASKPIRTGGTYGGTVNVDYKLDTTYTVIILWEPSLTKITSTLKNGETTVQTGSRTHNDYGSSSNYLSNWVFRCEDGAFEIDNFKFTDGTINYSEDFSYSSPESSMTYKGYWNTETLEKTGTAPEIKNGVLKFDTHDSLEFLWNKVVNYSSTMRYTFDFDLKVTNLGTGVNWGADTQTRVLYLAPGGYYNQLQVYTMDSKVVAGETAVSFDQTRLLNKNLKVRLVIDGDTITTSLYDENGNVVVTGSRTNSAYTNMTDRNSTMARLVFRCEDGAFEIDNLKLTESSIVVNEVTSFEIEENKAATFTCDLTYSQGEEANLKINGNNIISLSSDGMKVCSGIVKGTYETGTYKIKTYISPSQKMVNVEIVLPDGGILRRGTYSYVNTKDNTYKVDVRGYSASVVSNCKVEYSNVELNEYFIDSDEPFYDGMNEFIYNIITSFEDPATTRNFAWTTIEDIFMTKDMSIKYRPIGETDWLYEDAVLEDETVNNDEDFYKADLCDLKPDTLYEYKIGVKESDDEENEWTKSYTFKTAKENEEEFTFIAVGDTQGITWNGRSVSNKGFMYAKAAYDEAFEEVENPAFILHAGDVVENGSAANQWNYFFKSIGETVSSVPHFATIGNHDVVSTGSDPRFYFDLHFNHPNNGGTEALNPEYVNRLTNNQLRLMAQHADETFYSYNYGDAHFIVLNTGNYSSQDYYLLEAQREWLEEDLKYNACAKWTVILLHEPVYHRLGGSESRPWLYDVIEKYNVDLVIQGHSHLVTRTYPMKNGEITTKESPDVIKQGTGTVYTTIGSTALNHDSMGSVNVEECLLITTPTGEQSTYTTVTINGDKLVMTVKQINGLILDQFTIEANEELHIHHGEEIIVNAKQPICSIDGYTGDKVCSYCYEVIEKGTIIPASGSHKFGDWVVTKEATSTSTGEKKRTCSECNTVEVEVIEQTAKAGCNGSIGITITSITILGFMILISKLKKKKA